MNFASPPEWSLVIGSIGKASILVACLAFALAAIGWGLTRKYPKFQRFAAWSFTLGGLSVFSSFLSLALLFAFNRFEFAYVWGHADTSNALQYRIAGIWSGQEGSFLLWATTSTIFGLLAARSSGEYRRWYTIGFAVFLGSICGILAYESPFNLNLVDGRPVVPLEGVGLAPSLQNYWVTIHPPTIFLGFGSLAVPFCLALAALATRSYERWIAIVRPWAIVSMTLVGVGLCMGGFWAYETLGWGGFWMWDPVENVSFVPFVFMAAFVHGVIVQTAQKKWQIANLLLGGLPFLAFVYGTFLTRSGVLADTSVHSFAEMNRSALRLLLGFMGAAVVGFTALWIVRWVQARRATKPAIWPALGVNREAFYRFGAIFLILIGLAAMIGMSVPMALALAGRPTKVVEEREYHAILPWLFVPLMLLMAVGPFVSWRGMPTKVLLNRAYAVLCVAVGLTGFTLLAFSATKFSSVVDLGVIIKYLGRYDAKGLPWMLVLIGICYFALVGNVWRIVETFKRSKMNAAAFLSHIGIATLMAGLILSRGFERHEQTILMKDHEGSALGYQFKLAGMTSNTDDRNNKVLIDVIDPRKGAQPQFVAKPGLYYVTTPDGAKNPMIWPHIQRFPFHDVYVTLNPPQTDASGEMTLSKDNPLVVGGSTIRYVEMTRHGTPGTPGATFGVKVEVSNQTGSKIVEPKLAIGEAGALNKSPADLDGVMQIVLLGINANDGTATVQLKLSQPIYRLEVFTKPLTGLVWLGTGIFTLAGFLSAWYRRRRKHSSAANQMPDEDPDRPEATSDLELTGARI